MRALPVKFLPHSELLTFEEILRFVKVAVQLGVSHVRLTGGEPLVRRGIVDLVAMLAQVRGLDDLAMTTNGTLLAPVAGRLKAAGLHRLNISLDTLEPQKYCSLSRRDLLAQVIAGIRAAQEAGFEKIKLNALAIRGQTEPDIIPLTEFAREAGLELRFIEYMPLVDLPSEEALQPLPAAEILRILESHFGELEPEAPGHDQEHAPARVFRFRNGPGQIGIIPPMSDPFCDRCNRLRLTADGALRNCLFSNVSWDIKKLLRSEGPDERIAEEIRQAVLAKSWARGGETEKLPILPAPMHKVGG